MSYGITKIKYETSTINDIGNNDMTSIIINLPKD